MDDPSSPATIRPLSRSLDPLPGESLDGYLLRLAHRLRIAPLRLAHTVGCTPGSSTGISRRLLLGIDDLVGFAEATRLSPSEAETLTMASWRDHYPPILRSPTGKTGPRGIRGDAWTFNDAPRHCPNCLKGDGAAVQQSHGGPWRKIWQLPITFICLEHGRFLQHGCPQQHLPDLAFWQLITNAAADGMHPAQCRCRPAGPAPARYRARPLCGARLDHPRAAATLPQPSDDMLQTQAQLLASLDPSRPARQSSSFFTDLRLMAALLCASWPLGQELMRPEAAEAVAEHVRWLQQHSSGGARSNYPLDKPPQNPIAAGGLLTTATKFLGSDLSGIITECIDASWSGTRARAPWCQVLLRHQDSCSESFRLAAQSVIRSFRRHGLRGRIAPARAGGYGPEHIPAFLEQSWYEKHLAPLNSSTRMKAMRRTSASRLVQWVTGGPYDEAADYLGINPHGGRYKIPASFKQWLEANDASQRFTTALRDLAQDLDDAPDLIDYQRRREALQEWSLDTSTWHEIIDSLPPSPKHARPSTDARKQHAASAFIWARVTQGEPEFAPRPTNSRSPEDQRHDPPRQRGTLWSLLSHPNATPHYAALRECLNDHADQIAMKIDRSTETQRFQQAWPGSN